MVAPGADDVVVDGTVAATPVENFERNHELRASVHEVIGKNRPLRMTNAQAILGFRLGCKSPLFLDQ